MTIEETMASVFEAKLAPFRAEVTRLSSAVDALRRALPPTLVKVPEAARVLGLSKSTVRRRVKDGSIPTRRIGRAVLIDLSAIHPPTEAEVVRLAVAVKR